MAEQDFQLTALTPLDGRYGSRVEPLKEYFSESALIKYRVRVEVEYFAKLAKWLPQLSTVFKGEKSLAKWREIHTSFSLEDAKRCKIIEATTNHDVKAVEYFLKEKYDELKLGACGKEFIHFGLTSQDVNHVAQPLALAEYAVAVLIPKWKQLITEISDRAWAWREVAMLARTHGQPATPTVLGKEFGVFASRLTQCLTALEKVEFGAKFGGATGLLNAHFVAYPKLDWVEFAETFVEEISAGKLGRQKHTTQIEQYDGLAAFCYALCALQTVCLDLCRDAWQYISMGYFKQTIKKGEVGSSAMPHKVNPIDFENAEGNLGISIALLTHLAQKLPVSRLQRDLSDSTALRSLGTALGHGHIAVASALRGLAKLELDETALSADLDANWAVVAEAVQTVLRREAYPEPYEALKALTRTGKPINKESMKEFIDQLTGITASVRKELNNITPHNFIGKFDASDFKPASKVAETPPKPK